MKRLDRLLWWTAALALLAAVSFAQEGSAVDGSIVIGPPVSDGPDAVFAGQDGELDVEYIITGTGTTTNNYPWYKSGSSYSSVRCQYLYLATEVTRGGRIVEWGYKNSSTSKVTFNNVTIKMCHTTKTSLSETNFNNNYTGFTPVTVYSAASRLVGSGTVGNWDMFTLTAPFEYNGTNNLIIEIIWNGAPSDGIVQSYITSRNFRRAIVWDWQGNTGSLGDQQMNARLGFAELPPAPTQVSPANGGTVTTFTPALQVNSISGATKYHFRLFEPGIPEPLYENNNVATNTWTTPTLINGKTYEWDCAAFKPDGWGPFCGKWSFTVNAPPAAVTLTWPFNNGKNIPAGGASAQLAWSGGTGADSFRVYLGTTNPPPLYQSEVLGSPFYYSGLTPGAQYWWKVEAKNVYGITSSATRNFYVALGAPVQTEPENHALDQPVTGKLRWSGGAAATKWTVFFGTGATPDSATDVTTTEYDYSGAYETKYYWKIAAKDAVGQRTESAETWNFTTMAAAPGEFDLVAPRNDSLNAPVASLGFDWQDATGTEVKYDLYLGTDNPPMTPVAVDLEPSQHLLAGPLANDQDYYWRVQAKNVAGQRWSTSTFHFKTVVAAPAAPALAKPDNGAENQPISGYLHWHRADRATGYDVWLDENETPETQVAFNQPDTFLQYTLSNNIRYYWKVVARNVGGQAGSTVWNFKTVVPAPGVPALLSPANHAINQPTAGVLSWSPGIGGNPDGYDVYLDVVDPPLNRVSENQIGSTYGYSDLPHGVKHYWKVVAKNAGGEEQSETRDFQVRLAAPVLDQPGPGALNVEPEGDLTWTSTDGATHWTVFLGTSEPPDSVTDVTSAIHHYSGLESGGRYHWTVAAKDDNGQRTAAGETRDFHVKLGAPVQTEPENHALGQPITGKLRWTGGAGATKWTVFFGTGPEPDSVTNVTATEYDYTGIHGAKHYWKVAAKDAAGQRTESAETWDFTTIVDRPGAFGLASPGNGAGSVPVAGDLEWGAAARAETYDVYLKEGEEPGPDDKIGTVTHPVTTLPYSGHVTFDKTYYWYVVARNVGGDTRSEAVFYFTTIVDKPGAFELCQPADGQTSVPLVGNLTWEDAERMESYDVYLKEAEEPGPGDIIGSTTETEFPYTGHVEDGPTYYWYVVAKNLGGETRSTSVFRFTTGAGIPAWPERWAEVESMPSGANGKPVKDGGWLAAGPTAHGSQLTAGRPESEAVSGKLSAVGCLYVAKGNKTTDFYRYYPVEDSWVSCKEIPATEGTKTKPPSKGCVGVSDGQNYVYMTKGNNTLGFWRYDAEGDSWSAMPGVPLGPGNKKVKGGTDMVYVPGGLDTGWVYLLKGYKTEFYRFNTKTETWDLPLPDAPAGGGKQKYDKGSFLVYDPSGSIYAHQAKYYDKAAEVRYHYMFRYDLGTGRWTDTLKGMPLLGWHGGKPGKSKKSKDGAAGDWYAGNVYAIKGGNTQQFFRYFPEGDSWQEMDTVPGYGSTGKKKYVKQGADFASYYGGAFFLLKGNKTFEMWRYVIPADGLQPTAYGRTGVMAGSGLSAFSRMLIAPNPLSAGFATMRLSGHAVKWSGGLVRVFDAAGRCVLTRPLGHSATGSLSLDCRRLSSGVYLVRLDAGNHTATQKLVVQR